MVDRGTDHERIRNVGERAARDAGTPHDPAAPTDAGRTRGGGSLGHKPREDEREQSDMRNNATGSEDDPVMPADDATLNTKI